MDSFNKKEQDDHDKYFIEWIICDFQLFTVIDNSYFRMIVNYFYPCYSISEWHQVKDLVIKAFTIR